MRQDASAQAVDGFIEATGTSDAASRSALLQRVLADDIVFWGPLGRRTGRKAVDDFIVEVVHGHPRGPFQLIRTSRVDRVDEWARYGWRCENAAGQSILTGVDVVHLTARGDIDEFVIFAGSLG